MERKRFKLAMAQMLVEGGKPSANLNRAGEMIQGAAREGCSIVILPECLDIGWTHPSARELARPIPGEYSDELCTAASESRIFLVAGLTERVGDRIYNTAILVDTDGAIVLKHRKINILTIAQDLYSTGGSLQVVETRLGTLGIVICADNFASSLVFGHSLARMGARLLLSPSAWAVKADHDNEKDPYGATWEKPYTELARLYDMTVVGVSNVGPITGGPWKGRKCIGCSLAVGPGGKILARGPYGELAEALLTIEVEIVPLDVTGTAIADRLKGKGYTGP